MADEGKLAGRVAFVTGAASGQGAAEAALFADEGAFVYVADVDTERGPTVAEKLADRGEFVALDVADYDAWQRTARVVADRFGRLDVLVNNAGIGVPPRLLHEMTIADHHRTIDINLHGVFYGLHAMHDLLVASGNASVINTSSIDGIAGVLGMSSYSASKFAVTGLTKVAAIELGPSGVRVNSIHPGVIETPMVAAAPVAVRERLDVLMGRQPLRRMGTADEIAKLALFLASDDSSYCTGAEFVIDGGHLAGPYRDPVR
jgi:3alpha(or 20beta)-hydroxysteroid dehydrogenase